MNKIMLFLSVFAFVASSCGRMSNKQAKIANNEDVYEQINVEKNQVDLFFPLKKMFDWTSIEKENQELKTTFIQNHPKEFEYYRLNDEYTPDLSDLETHLHIVDFNGDGLDDVIFHGESGGEAKEIIIFINKGQSFAKILTEYQEIYKIVFENGKVQKLYIQDGGCCCEYILTNKIFGVDYSDVLPKINLINQMQYLNNSIEEYPSSYLEKPIKFEVLNDKYNIRFSPVIDDTTEIWYCGEPKNGNFLGEIKSGAIGYALAKKVDLTGRIWWFVALHPNSEIYESIYYDDDIRPNSYKLGWISSRFVKEIKE